MQGRRLMQQQNNAESGGCELLMEKILALDLGTTTGFCAGDFRNHLIGTWNLKPGKFDGGGMRYVKFRENLDRLHASMKLDRVVFEAVRRHNGTDAAHVYGGLMAHLTEWCETRAIPYYGVPVGTIKKFWTGNGNANKAAMIERCHASEIVVADDNEADAVALFHYAIREYMGGPECSSRVPTNMTVPAS